MTVYRIYRRLHAATAFSGEGARLFGGRWNSAGIRMVYCSASLSLATLELIVNAGDGPLPPDYVFASAAVPESLTMSLDVAALPENWHNFPAPRELQRLGDEWVRSRRSAALIVPSAVTRIEFNVLLNPDHRRFAAIAFESGRDLPIDPRLPRLGKTGKR